MEKLLYQKEKKRSSTLRIILIKIFTPRSLFFAGGLIPGVLPAGPFYHFRTVKLSDGSTSFLAPPLFVQLFPDLFYPLYMIVHVFRRQFRLYFHRHGIIAVFQQHVHLGGGTAPFPKLVRPVEVKASPLKVPYRARQDPLD
jgi:hypothetical protein